MRRLGGGGGGRAGGRIREDKDWRKWENKDRIGEGKRRDEGRKEMGDTEEIGGG